ncbi:hypothetical protein T09_7720, partial [Trichinella sp. T9]
MSHPPGILLPFCPQLATAKSMCPPKAEAGFLSQCPEIRFDGANHILCTGPKGRCESGKNCTNMDDQLETAYEAKFSVLDMDVAKKAEGASKAAGPINEAEQKRQAELMKQASIAVQSALGEQASAA